MKVFNVGDKVKINSKHECSANKHWFGKVGEIIKILGEDSYLVKWEHLEKPMESYGDLIELAPKQYGF